MKKIVTLILFFLASSVLLAQEVKQGLVVVHVDPTGKAEFKQKIMVYHFLNGHYTGRTELLTVTGKKDGKDNIRTDLGINTLYNNRYLITGIGNIIDLKEKKVLWDGRASLLRCSNDSAIFYTNDIFKGKYYSVYNFKTNVYGEVKNLMFKPKVGQDVEFDKTTAPFKINFYPQSKPKILLVADAGYGQSGTKDGRVPDPPMYWLDNSNFVYSNFNKDNTEISFFKVNIDSKTNSLIGKIAIKPDAQNAQIQKVSNTQALFFFGSKQILVDVAANTVTDLQFTKPIDGFSYECKTNSYGHLVKLNDKDVGKYHFQPKNFKTENNIASLVKELVVGPESYQQGMAVWNANKQGWENVDSEDVLTLVGWIKE
ncbi:MAG: hypothetical protein H0W73_07405 [Bacteroidetes bacterium]|nr:hypothetical protein [Bacteroidota bacterium]